jgi:hypothetical protein
MIISLIILESEDLIKKDKVFIQICSIISLFRLLMCFIVETKKHSFILLIWLFLPRIRFAFAYAIGLFSMMVLYVA